MMVDANEVVNPLGFGCVLLNTPPQPPPPHLSAQTLIICSWFKAFGQSKVFSELLADLKVLEENRLPTANETVVDGSPLLYCWRQIGHTLHWWRYGKFLAPMNIFPYIVSFQADDPTSCGQEHAAQNYQCVVDQII